MHGTHVGEERVEDRRGDGSKGPAAHTSHHFAAATRSSSWLSCPQVLLPPPRRLSSGAATCCWQLVTLLDKQHLKSCVSKHTNKALS